MPDRRPQLRIVAPAASPEEAAAVVAALEQFMCDTAPPHVPQVAEPPRWERAALLEGIGYGPDEHSPWGLGAPPPPSP